MFKKESIDKTVTRVQRYLRQRREVHLRRVRPMEIVWEISARDSAEFVMQNLDVAILTDNRPDLWRQALKAIPAEGLVMECGVFQGESINFIGSWMKRRNDERTIEGFDSFQGLEEDWQGEALPKGFFDLEGKLPTVGENINLHVGWVQETVPPFLAESPDTELAFLHIDTDTYTPAKFLLETLRPYMRRGTIIVFDELIGYPGWRLNEHKALQETMDRSEYEFIAFTNRQAAIRVTADLT